MAKELFGGLGLAEIIFTLLSGVLRIDHPTQHLSGSGGQSVVRGLEVPLHNFSVLETGPLFCPLGTLTTRCAPFHWLKTLWG